MGTNDIDNTNGSTTQSPLIVTKHAVHVPADADVAHWLSEIDALVVELGSYTQALTPAERRRMLKIRKGGERHIEQIASTAARYGLAFPGGSVEELRANTELVTKLSTVLTRLNAASEVVSDTILRARDSAWKGTTSAYTMLSRMSRNMPSIATEIAGATELFARKRKSPKAAAAPAVSGSADGGAVATPAAPAVGAQPSGHAAAANGASASIVNGASAPVANGAAASLAGLGK